VAIVAGEHGHESSAPTRSDATPSLCWIRRRVGSSPVAASPDAPSNPDVPAGWASRRRDLRASVRQAYGTEASWIPPILRAVSKCAAGLVIAAAFGMTGEPAVAQATPTPVSEWPHQSCAANLTQIPSAFDIDTDDEMRSLLAFSASHPTSISLADQAGAPVQRQAEAAIATCPRGSERDLLRGYALAWRGFVEHYAGDDRAADDLNLATQLFANCVALAHATEQGARCESAQERVARWKVDWSIAPR
jgi:hypothetical protein